MVKKDIALFEDPFDSPLSSPTPMGDASLSTVSTSVLAEHIFNDPEAWEVPKEASSRRHEDYLSMYEIEMDEEMAWLEREIRLSVPFTPSILDMAGSPLSDEEDATLPDFPLQHVTPHPHLASPKRLRDGQSTTHPRCGPIAIFPAYARSPPSGFNISRQELMKDLIQHQDDDIFSSNHGCNDSLDADLHAFLVGISKDTTRPMMGRVPGSSSIDISPLSSGYSSSSNSSSPCSSRSSPTLDLQVFRSLGHPAESAAAATRNVSSIKIHPASHSTVCPLEQYGSRTDPSTDVAETRELLADVPALSSTKHRNQSPSQDQLLPRSAILNICASDDALERFDRLPDVLESAKHEKRSGRLGDCRTQETIITDPNDVPSKFNFPDNSKRRGMICESPSRRRLNIPQLMPRDSPKPAPIIPLPDLPRDEPPPVPPKDEPSPPKTDTNKANIRRLPAVPTQYTTPGCELNIKTNVSPRLPSPHMRTHSSPHSITTTASYSAVGSTMPTRRPGNPDASSCSGSLLGSTRSLPCPAGPRQRSCMNNNYAPIRPPWYTTAQVVINTSSVSGTGATTKSSVTTVVRRSISEPRGLQRHMYSKSG